MCNNLVILILNYDVYVYANIANNAKFRVYDPVP